MKIRIKRFELLYSSITCPKGGVKRPGKSIVLQFYRSNCSSNELVDFYKTVNGMEDIKMALVQNCSSELQFSKVNLPRLTNHTVISTIIISSYNEKFSRFSCVIEAIPINFSGHNATISQPLRGRGASNRRPTSNQSRLSFASSSQATPPPI